MSSEPDRRVPGVELPLRVRRRRRRRRCLDRAMVNRQRAAAALLLRAAAARSPGARCAAAACSTSAATPASGRCRRSRRGADFVLGVDARQMHVDQAELVFEAKGVDRARYRFEQGNVLRARARRALRRRALPRAARPRGKAGRAVRADGAAGRRADRDRHRNLARARRACSRSTACTTRRRPSTIELVADPLARGASSSSPRSSASTPWRWRTNMTDYAGLSDYRRQRRLAFICAKDARWRRWSAEPRPPLVTAGGVRPLRAERAAARRGALTAARLARAAAPLCWRGPVASDVSEKGGREMARPRRSASRRRTSSCPAPTGRFGSPSTAASASCCCSTRATTRWSARNSSAPTATAPATSRR